MSVDGSTFTVTLPPQTVTTFVSDEIRVSNEALPALPSGYGLNQNFPNRFNPSTLPGWLLARRSVSEDHHHLGLGLISSG